MTVELRFPFSPDPGCKCPKSKMGGFVSNSIWIPPGQVVKKIHGATWKANPSLFYHVLPTLSIMVVNRHTLGYNPYNYNISTTIVTYPLLIGTLPRIDPWLSWHLQLQRRRRWFLPRDGHGNLWGSPRCEMSGGNFTSVTPMKTLQKTVRGFWPKWWVEDGSVYADFFCW